MLEVERGDEFSPVKNALGSIKDSPNTAREDLYRLHHHQVCAAGGRIVDAQGKLL